ncbi:MAG: hypothetical protein M1497_06245 [Nitrospirae bacterium]|nr:hypothetical protein [Nitrospirota bacterium]
MKKESAGVLLLLCFVLGFAVNAIAEPRGDFERPPSREQMEKVRKRIETLKMWKLTRALDLDEKTSAQVFPLLNRYDRKRADLEKAMRDNMRELKDALKEGRENQMKNILGMIEESHKSIQALKDAEWQELKGIFTTEQQAKFVFFQQEFDREMRKIIGEARERRHDRFGKDNPERPSPLHR